MITAVLDTKVLASGFAGEVVATSTPGELIRRWRRNAFALVVSEHILMELTDAFQVRYFSRRLTARERLEALGLLRRRASFARIGASVTGVATHPEDDLVLAAAVSAGVHYLVTGDGPFRRRVPRYQGVGILSRGEVLDLLEAEGRRHDE